MAEMNKIDLGLCGGQHCTIEDIKRSYVKMIEPLKERMGSAENGLTGMPLMKGNKFCGNEFQEKAFRILFVGRAVDGSWCKIKPGSAEEIVDQIFASAMDTAQIGKGIVNYVDDDGNEQQYNYNRSPFFQLCHAVMEQFGFGDDWSEHLAWTNLYKISPCSGGNPNNKLISETLDSCACILRKEISYLRPTHIVFITGDWWYKPTGKKPKLDGKSFAEKIGVDLFDNTNQIIVGSGISETFLFHPNVVITQRPESAKISRKDHAQAIFNAFAENEKSRPMREDNK
jgi:hypothetical protein